MDTPTNKRISVLFFRVFWLLIGPVGLVYAADSIVQSGSEWSAAKDLPFGAMLLGTILCRWGDFWNGGRRNLSGEPMTGRDMQRYTFVASLAGGAIWAAAHFVGNFRQ